MTTPPLLYPPPPPSVRCVFDHALPCHFTQSMIHHTYLDNFVAWEGRRETERGILRSNNTIALQWSNDVAPGNLSHTTVAGGGEGYNSSSRLTICSSTLLFCSLLFFVRMRTADNGGVDFLFAATHVRSECGVSDL